MFVKVKLPLHFQPPQLSCIKGHILATAVSRREDGKRKDLVMSIKCSRHICCLLHAFANKERTRPASANKERTRPASRAGDSKPAARKGSKPKRQAPVVGLRRCDIPWGRPQPWDIDYQTTVGELLLAQLSSILATSEAAVKEPVDVRLAVNSVGAGLYVKGEVRSSVHLLCDCCTGQLIYPAYGTFQVWLDAKEDRGGDADANEIYFPQSQQVADLSGICQEALLSGLPVAPRCASTDCVSGAQVYVSPHGIRTGWLVAPSHGSKNLSASLSDSKLAQLQGLRKALETQ
eukprot:jgi/Botrbrau1/22583/Bobra.176_1s0014.3